MSRNSRRSAVAICFGVLCAAPAAAAASPLDDALGSLTPLAGVPGNMNAPDLNGDGRADLAVPDFGTDHLSTRINNGDGTFSQLRRYKVGVKPSFIARGDFNEDGRIDLATSNALSADVSVLIGNGDGTLQQARSYPISATGSFSLEAVDVDGDANEDLVVSNSITNDLSVLRGRGDGTFARASNYPIAGPKSIGIIPFALSVADFDGDGDPDAVTGGVASVTFMTNEGGGRYRATSSNFVGIDIACTKVGDLDEDGDLDVAATGTATLNTQILLNNGNGTFRAGQNLFANGFGSQCESVEDLDGDGHLDLAVVNTASPQVRGNVAVFRGNGGGTFGGDIATSTYPVNFAPWATAVADFDRDGRLDTAVANSFPASVSILIGNGDATFRPAVSYGM
jgi:hypothetical protein